MSDKSLEDVICCIEKDKELKEYFGRDKPLSSGILDDLGVLMEEKNGKILVKVRLQDKASDDFKIAAFNKLLKYIEEIDALNIPRPVKGYVVKKLEAIATVKIGRD